MSFVFGEKTGRYLKNHRLLHKIKAMRLQKKSGSIGDEWPGHNMPSRRALFGYPVGVFLQAVRRKLPIWVARMTYCIQCMKRCNMKVREICASRWIYALNRNGENSCLCNKTMEYKNEVWL